MQNTRIKRVGVEAGQRNTLTRLVACLEIALVILITVLLVRAVIAFVSPESLWTESHNTVIAAAPTQAAQARNFNINFDPFNRQEVAAAPAELGLDAPETSLNLKLTGLRAGAEGSAFLQTPDNKQRAYTIGEEVISGVTLHGVTPRYVVLSLGGRLERLTFPRSQKQPIKANSQTISRVTRLSANKFIDSINIQPVQNGDRLRGFRITPKKSDVNLKQFGLQTGDIITRIGTQDLTTGQPNFLSIARSLESASTVDLTLLRAGREITVKAGSK